MITLACLQLPHSNFDALTSNTEQARDDITETFVLSAVCQSHNCHGPSMLTSKPLAVTDTLVHKVFIMVSLASAKGSLCSVPNICAVLNRILRQPRVMPSCASENLSSERQAYVTRTVHHINNSYIERSSKVKLSHLKTL